MPSVLVAITGASGGLYGVRAAERLLEHGLGVQLILSEAGRKVLAIEHGLAGDPRAWFSGAAPELLQPGDITAPSASGSRAPAAMLVAPCSMGTLARIATGVSGNLIERSADVMLKEQRPLVLVPRETPLSTLHLRNLLTLAEMGARIVPAMPAFYTRPESLEDMIAFVVDRALAATGLELPLRARWRTPGEDQG